MDHEKSTYATTPKPRPLPRYAPKLHHATFMTLEIDPMVKFYEAVCGLQPIFYSEHAAWLVNDEANHRIALLRIPGTMPPVNKPRSAGIHHTAFEYATFDQWLDNYIRLRDLGIHPAFSMDHGMTMSIYYCDPDGNGIEIQVDNFHDWERSSEWMWASREFSEDQLGPQFDPELLVAARGAGLDHDEIHRRAYAREYLPRNPVANPMFPDPWPDRIAENPDFANGVPFPPLPGDE